MPPDPAWGGHIHVTGYWYHPEETAEGYTVPEALRELISGKYDRGAVEAGERIRKENGVKNAADVIENFY